MSRFVCALLLLGPLVFVGSGVLWAPAPQSSSSGRYADHPPIAHTGGFGEPTCHACHFGAGVNGGDGTLTVEGLPEQVTPGSTHHLSVRLADSMGRAGFMLAIRQPDRAQAGRLSPVDTGRVAVRTVDSTGVQYAHHTLSGTRLTGKKEATWQVEWSTPARPGDTICVHVSANAANDDASEFGDDIYTTSVTLAGPKE